MKLVVVGDKTHVAKPEIITGVLAMMEKPPSIVIGYEGTPVGRMVEEYCIEKGINCTLVEADFDKYKAGAGYARNKRIMEMSPTHVLAFPGKRVVADMIKRAKASGVIVYDLSDA